MSQSNSNINPRVTWEGCSVLLDINDGDRLVFARLSPGATLKIGNKNCKLQPLIGCPYGSLFQLETGKDGPFLSRVVQSTDDNDLYEKVVDSELKEESKDNRSLVDDNKAQSLTGEDIDTMRSEGATGDQIVEALIANSATFEKKTTFSQEKYRLKKQKKYAPKVLLRRPFTRSICEAYFKKHPNRIGFMRVDALSLLLSMANVSANTDVLVVDMVGGLLTGAVAERLGGSGHVCNTYVGSAPYAMDIVRTFNFSTEVCIRIVRCSLSDLCSAPNGTSEIDDTCKVESQTTQTNEISTPMDSSPENKTIDPSLDTETSIANRPSKAPKAGDKPSEELLKLWKENGFSSLIVAAPELDSWNLMEDILPLLSYSAPFAIYHQNLQPLAICMNNLQREKLAIGLQLSEPWLREYQVLPSRTHPHMQMSAFGGYILTGTKIASS